MDCTISRKLGRHQEHVRKNRKSFINTAKCGEIFYHKKDNSLIISFHCIKCRLIFYDLKDFLYHIKNVDCKGSGDAVINEENALIQALFPNNNCNCDMTDSKETQNEASKLSTLCDHDADVKDTLTSTFHGNCYNQHKSTCIYNECASGSSPSIKTLASGNVYTCERCLKVFKTKWNLLLHMCMRGSTKFRNCTQLEINSSNSNPVTDHVQEQCDFSRCSTECQNPTRNKHDNNNNAEACCHKHCVCSEYNTDLKDCSDTRVISNEDSNIFCQLCNRHFRKRYQLTVHQITVHKDFPRFTDDNNQVSYETPNIQDQKECNTNGTIQKLTPSIGNIHRKNRKNLAVTFAIPETEKPLEPD